MNGVVEHLFDSFVFFLVLPTLSVLPAHRPLPCTHRFPSFPDCYTYFHSHPSLFRNFLTAFVWPVFVSLFPSLFCFPPTLPVVGLKTSPCGVGGDEPRKHGFGYHVFSARHPSPRSFPPPPHFFLSLFPSPPLLPPPSTWSKGKTPLRLGKSRFESSRGQDVKNSSRSLPPDITL
jgi:hypothetical protein